jgi:hypothetical protein
MLVWFNVESYWWKVSGKQGSMVFARTAAGFKDDSLYRGPIIWECNTVITSEADPISLPRGSGGSGDDLRRTVLLPHPQTSRRYTDPKWVPTKTDMMNAARSKLVGAYTQAKLTLKTDKLVAISGLARKADKLHAHASGQYLAGLWEANLPIELLWRVIDPASASPTRPNLLCSSFMVVVICGRSYRSANDKSISEHSNSHIDCRSRNYTY